MRVTANVLLRNPRTGQVTVINAGDEVPGWAAGRVGAHVLEQDAASTPPATHTPPEPVGYASRTVASLREEIERRNEGRDEADLLPVDGKKADLVAALEADDDN